MTHGQILSILCPCEVVAVTRRDERDVDPDDLKNLTARILPGDARHSEFHGRRMEACSKGCPIADADVRTAGGRWICGTCGRSE